MSTARGPSGRRKKRRPTESPFKGDVTLNYDQRPSGMSRDDLEEAILKLQTAQTNFGEDARRQADQEQECREKLKSYTKVSEHISADRLKLSELELEVQKQRDSLPAGGEKAAAIEEYESSLEESIRLEADITKYNSKLEKIKEELDGLRDAGGAPAPDATPEGDEKRRKKLTSEKTGLRHEYDELVNQETDLRKQHDEILLRLRELEAQDEQNKQDELEIRQTKRVITDTRRDLEYKKIALESQKNQYEQYNIQREAKQAKYLSEVHKYTLEKQGAETEVAELLEEVQRLKRETEDYAKVTDDVSRMAGEQEQIKRDKWILEQTAQLAEREMKLTKARAGAEDRLNEINKQYELLGTAKADLDDDGNEQFTILQENLEKEKGQVEERLTKISGKEAKLEEQRQELEIYKEKNVRAVDEDLQAVIDDADIEIDSTAMESDTLTKIALLQANRRLQNVTSKLEIERGKMARTKAVLETRSEALEKELSAVQTEKAKVDPSSGELEKQSKTLGDLKAKWEAKEASLGDKFKTYVRKKARMDKEKNEVTAQLEKIESERATLVILIEKGRAELEMAQSRQDDMNGRKARFDIEKQEQRQKWAKSKYKLEADKKNMAIQRARVDEKKDAIKEKTEDSEKWKAKLHERRTELQALEEALEQQRQALAQAEADINQKKELLATTNKEIEEDMRAVQLLQSSAGKARELANMMKTGKKSGFGGHQQSEFAVLKTELVAVREDLIMEKNDFIEKRKQVQLRKKNIEAKKAKIKDERAKLTELKSEIDDMKKSLEAVQVQMQQEAEELEHNRLNSQKVRQSLVSNIKGFKSFAQAQQWMVGHKEIIEAQRTHIKIEYQHFTEELKNIMDGLEKLRERMDDLAHKKREINEDDESLRAKEDQCNEMQRELIKASKRLAAKTMELKQKKKECESELADLRIEKQRLEKERMTVEMTRPKDDLERIQEKIAKERGAVVTLRDNVRKKNKALSSQERELDKLRMQVDTAKNMLMETEEELAGTKQQLIEMVESHGIERQRRTTMRMNLEKHRQDVRAAHYEADLKKESYEVLMDLIKDRRLVELQKEEVLKLLDSVTRDTNEINKERELLQTHLDRMEDIDESTGGSESLIARELANLAEAKKAVSDKKQELMRIIKKIAQEKEKHEVERKIIDKKKDDNKIGDQKYYDARDAFIEQRKKYERAQRSLVTRKQKVEEDIIVWAREQVRVQEELLDTSTQLEKVMGYRGSLMEKKTTVETEREQMQQDVEERLKDVIEQIATVLPPDQGDDMDTASYRVAMAGSSEVNGVYFPAGEDNWMYQDDDTMQTYRLIREVDEDENLTFWIINGEKGEDEYDMVTVEYYQAEVDGINADDPPTKQSAWEVVDEDGYVEGKDPMPKVTKFDPIEEAQAALNVIPDSVESQVSVDVMSLKRKLLWEKENSLILQVHQMREDLMKLCNMFSTTCDNAQFLNTNWQDLMETDFDLQTKTGEIRRVVTQLKSSRDTLLQFKERTAAKRKQQKKKSAFAGVEEMMGGMDMFGTGMSGGMGMPGAPAGGGRFGSGGTGLDFLNDLGF